VGASLLAMQAMQFIRTIAMQAMRFIRTIEVLPSRASWLPHYC